MDFVHLIASKQLEKGLTDLEVSIKTGINEYTYYNLKKYRIYLSRVAYYALSCVFSLNILSDKDIDGVLEENRKIVGNPESNLSIAAECVNPETLERLELELNKLKRTLDTVDEKNKVINKLYSEIDLLKKELLSIQADITERVKQAFSDGVIEGSKKIESMKMSNNQQFINSLNAEYTEKINKLELALKKVDLVYTRLYKEVQIARQNNVVADIHGFDKPLLLMKEEMGLDLKDSLIGDILTLYYQNNDSVDRIANKLGIETGLVESVIINYGIKDNNGVSIYVKRQ